MIDERRVTRLVLVGLALILVAGLTQWFFTHFERRTETIPVGLSAAARRNDLLAAERYLARLGIPVESVTGRRLLVELPPPTDTLLVRGLGPTDPTRRARLRDWLARGGRLVVEAVRVSGPDEAAPSDDLLADFGIRLRAAETDEEGREGDGKIRVTLATPGQTRPSSVTFLANYHLDCAEAAADDVGAGGHPRLVSRTVGKGRLTVLSDSRFMGNAEIGKQDHAFVTASLVAPAPGGKVWLLYDSAMPGLGELLRSNAPYALTAATVTLAIWLWSLGGRLGPLLPVPPPGRRDLIEHLEASGDFLWRHGRAVRLVESSRRRILARWLRGHPDLAASDRRTQSDAVARTIAQPPDAVTRALMVQAEDEAAFVDQARLLRAVWLNATRGAHPGRALEAELAGRGSGSTMGER